MKVLLPVATENPDKKLIDWAVKCVDTMKAELDVLNVQYSYETFTLAYPTYPEFVYVSDVSNKTHDEKSLSQAKKIAETVAEKIKSKSNSKAKVRAIAEIGDPALCIIQLAEKKGYDLILIKDRDRSDVGRFFLGSITDKVVHHTNLPVLVLK